MKKVIEARGLRLEVAPEVYTPREDSFLMADLLSCENLDPNVLFEIGPGTGIISFSIAPKTSTLVSIDINPIACLQVLDNAKINQFDSTLVVCSDRLRAFRKGALGKSLIFNPPYLPEDPEIDPYSPLHEQQQLVGGKRGDEILSELLDTVREEVVMYSIISSLAVDPVTFANDHRDWDIRVLQSENMGFETIWVLKMERK